MKKDLRNPSLGRRAFQKFQGKIGDGSRVVETRDRECTTHPTFTAEIIPRESLCKSVTTWTRWHI